MSQKLDISIMSKKELLSLQHYDINFLLNKDEILNIFRQLGGLWLYDYEVAKEGKVGFHAELKFGQCSDGFLNSKTVLKYDNLRKIFAKQMIRSFNQYIDLKKPTYVVGVPNSATKLGEDVADFMGVKKAKMIKENGKIKMVTKLKTDDTILLVEDICTKGTGFKEAVGCMKFVENQIFPFELVIINRGQLEYINMLELGYSTYKIEALAKHKINEWEQSKCPLCKIGSKRIKPKETEKNWRRITLSQL